MTNIIKRKAPRTFATNVNDMHRVATGKLKGKIIAFKGLHAPNLQDQKHIRLLTSIAAYLPHLKNQGPTSDARLVARELIKYLAANKNALRREHFEKARTTIRKILNNLSESQKADLLREFLTLRHALATASARPARRTASSRARRRVAAKRTTARKTTARRATAKRATAKRTTLKRTVAKRKIAAKSRTTARRKTAVRTAAKRRTTSRLTVKRKSITAKRRSPSGRTTISRRSHTTIRTAAKRRAPARSAAKRKASRAKATLRFKSANPKMMSGLKMFLRQKYRQQQKRI